MRFKSTKGGSEEVDFKEAVIRGQAQNGGLYFPTEIPEISKDIIHNIKNISEQDLAYHAIHHYVDDSIPEVELNKIIEETLAFKTPLIKLDERFHVLELFHGPTLAFKDIGARFMSRCLAYFSKENNNQVTVLVATSGDTGSAVADGFFGVENVEVVILYPSGKVSAVQEKQLTTYGGNVRAIEVMGNFDDCQRLVKQAFSDTRLRETLQLTSANSINIARWLPQQFYYFNALKQWDKKEAPVISVPSGNFGNICAGILAWKSGLPVKHFIAACNVNNVVSEFLSSGNYQPKKAIPTISNAMDVGDPSNFVRIMEIFSNNIPGLKSMLSSFYYTDEDTKSGMREIKKEFNYTAEPHGAIGYMALKDYLKIYPSASGIFLETAHPVKFPDAVEEEIRIPDRLKHIMSLKKNSVKIEPDYAQLRKLLEIRN